jgi:hypothetical protein
MTKPIARDPMYRRRSFDADIIELCVRWYITALLTLDATVLDHSVTEGELKEICYEENPLAI